MRWPESGQQTDAFVLLGARDPNPLPFLSIYSICVQSSTRGRGRWGHPCCPGCTCPTCPCWGHPTYPVWSWAQLWAPGEFSGQRVPCLGRSPQIASLDLRVWCLQSAEALFWYPNPFWTYVCSITLLKCSENQTHYLLFSNDIRCYSHVFPPLNSTVACRIGSVAGNFSFSVLN